MQRITASAPGKLFLTGEYAVLDGAPAMLSAVDVRASCRLESSTDDTCRIHTPPLRVTPGVFRIHEGELAWDGEPVGLMQAAWQALSRERRLRFPEGGWQVTLDTTAFYLENRKLGLGSSAAALTALMGALWSASGGLPDEAEAFAALQDAHAGWQGGGSGGDLATSLTGGTLLYRRAPRIVAPVALPEGLEILPVWSGESASTAAFLETLDAFGRKEPHILAERLAVLRHAADTAALAASDNDANVFRQAFAATGAGMRALGDAAGLPIWSAAHERAGEQVRMAGGDYKPSGAGGGDIGLALLPTGDGSDAEQVKSALSSAGFRVLPLRFGARGMSIAAE